MADRYANWAALVGDTNADGSPVNVEGRDYAITVRPGSGDYIGWLAIHGGGIEPPTQQLADYCSQGAAFYSFAGLKESGNEDLHITSAHYDEPQALAFAATAGRIVSFHGHADRTAGYAVTYVGGLDTELGALIRARLVEAGFVCENPPADLAGTEPLNIANRARIGRGVHLELSQAQRNLFFTGSASDPNNRTDAFYRYCNAVRQATVDLFSVDDTLFDLRGGAERVFDTPVALDQTRVHQQACYEPTTKLLYVTQVIANGVKLADESAPPPTGTRDARGDLAINRVTLAGQVTGVMYCRAFDHGSGIGAEYDAATGKTYLWLAYDAAMEPIGSDVNAHGRKLVRLPFVDGAIIDVGSAGLDVYVPVPGMLSVTPGLDLANRRMTIAYTAPGQSGTWYAAYDLAQFKAKNFDHPLYSFPRPTGYGLFQSWIPYGNYIYQQHGSGYDDDNPPPPQGEGNAYFVVIDVRSGRAIDRVPNNYQASLEYREPESLAVWLTPDGPHLVFGFAVSNARRAMDLYRMAATVDTGVAVQAQVVTTPETGVQLTISVDDTESIQTWEIGRVIGGAVQPLFSGQGAGSLPAVSSWLDTSPPGCIAMVYRLVIHRADGTEQVENSAAVTFVPDGGCSTGGEAVGEQPNILGCAEEYTARLHWRGGALPYEAAIMSTLTEASWGRTINDISEASVTVLKGDVSGECCEALSEAEPWVHELTLYRDGELVWQGPIDKITARRDSVTIHAVDVFSWFDRLVNVYKVAYKGATADSNGRKAMPIVQIAANHIRLNLMDTRLNAIQDYPGILNYLVMQNYSLVKVTVEKDGSSNNAIWAAQMGDILREWTKRGLRWTTVGRALVLSSKPQGQRSTPTTQARLTDEDFIGDVEIIKDGTQAATYAFVTTQDGQDVSKGKTVGKGRTGTAYGRLDRLVELDDEDTSDADMLAAANDALTGRYPVPVTISVPDGAALAPTAPVNIGQLVPGYQFDVLASSFCQRVLQSFMLTDVDVSWQDGQEKVGVTFIPADQADEELTGS
ncbi:poly-gamma-glutamate hydrolase family protein [Streptomyces andamanensis]|uniref:Poly-gamma-glutamate hydrolase family protein n=1 Tax=Streptomyces andamanensis TaxID=1565035 RepID=A0ABV8TCL2_9ACTN